MNMLQPQRGRRLALLAISACVALAGEARAQVTSITAEVMSAGSGWQLLNVTDPQAGTGGSGLMYMVSPAGVDSLPVSQAQKNELLTDFQGQPQGAVIYVVKEIAEAMDAGTFPSGYEQYAESLSIGDCFGWKDESKTKDFTFDETTLERSFDFTDGVSGNLSLTVPVTGQAHLVGRYSIKRAACIPYKFKFLSASLDGNLAMSGAGSLDASVAVSQHWEKEWKLAEPELTEFTVWIGPVPVRFVVTLPIYAGAAFDATLTGTVSASIDLATAGTFSYYCTPDTCTGSSQFTDDVNLNGPNGGVSVDLKAQAFARVMARLAVYDASVAYVEGGLKGHADARLWGYYGNACGDADGDGQNETVHALAADLSWGYDVRYGIGGFLLPDRDWTGTTRTFPLGWRDLLGTGGSTALGPMLAGPDSVDQGATASYTVKMRPCYPYNDQVNFTLTPGTWIGNTFFTPPGSSTLQRDFPDAGPVTLTVTVTGDAAGRGPYIPLSRPINVVSGTPNAPSALAPTAQSPTSVRLTWQDNSNNETGFQVQRRTTPSGTFATIATTAANATSLTDNGVQQATSYEYRVRAVNGTYNSAWSGVAPVTTPTAPPTAPSGLAAWFEITPKRIRLNWVDNSSNEQGFQVQFSYSGSAFADMTPATVGAGVTSYTGGTNPPTGSYQFRVRAFVGGVYSSWSNVAALIVTTPVSGYQGCYTDASSRALPIQLAGTTHTLESCKQAAYNAGYKYAGAQYYGYCFAGNSLGYTLVTDAECSTPCSSNPAQMCGGSWRNSVYATGYVPQPSASIAWIKPAENSWGPAGTLTAAGYAANGSGGVQLVWRERAGNGVWGAWQTVTHQATPGTDTSWSNTISSGNPTNKCHYFDAYVKYSGVTSTVFHYTGWPGCPQPSASIAWIQPAENSWGPAGTLTAAGYAANGSGGVQLVWRERASNGVWGAWQTVAYQPPPAADTTWSNTISSGSPTNKCHYFDAYVNYAGVTSAVFHYTGWTGCP